MLFSDKTETRDEELSRLRAKNAEWKKWAENWHPYFALLPVPVAKDTWAWFQLVERRFTRVWDVIPEGYDPEYRLRTQPPA